MILRYISPIDSHVHLRGREYENFSYDGMNFMELSFRDAKAVGLKAMIEMPNTTPNLIDEETIEARLKQAEEYSKETGIYHGLFAGTTTNMDQVRDVFLLAKKSMDEEGKTYGIKIYHAQSTGDMGILDLNLQREIPEIAVEVDYNGAVVNHLECEAKYTDIKFDFRNPITHSLRQNPESELIQAERQIKNFYDAGFEGTFISAHTSNPNTIDYILKVRDKMPFRIAVEMSWHHMFLNTDDYEIHENRVKMNPPLRSKEMQERNLEHVLTGNVDMVGSDHAPHPIERKDSDNPPSGVSAILAYPLGIARLMEEGIERNLLDNILFHNSDKIFNLNLKPRIVEVEYKPELWKSYGYNPFSRLENELGWRK